MEAEAAGEGRGPEGAGAGFGMKNAGVRGASQWAEGLERVVDGDVDGASEGNAGRHDHY